MSATPERMSAKPERAPAMPGGNAERLFEPLGDDADELRTLVGALLGGSYQEQFYLWDVASVCRAKPDFARQLLCLIDRYQRLGQMPPAQHQRIRQMIEQSLAAHDTRSAAAESPTGALRVDASGAGTDTTLVPAVDEPRRRFDPTITAPLPAAAPAPAPSAPPRKSLFSKFRHSEPARPTGADAAGATEAGPELQPPVRSHPVQPSAPAQVAPSAPAPTPPPAAPPPVAPPISAPVAPATSAPAAPISPVAPGVSSPAVIGPGSVLRGRYELQGLLGCGGMASVYSAVDRYRASLGLADCRVAVKVVTAQPGRLDSVAALGREFHHAQLLSHPNVVNVYEIDHEADARFYTMELLEGERLSQLTQRIGGPLPRRQALAIIRDIGAAIAHAHSRGVVHGDIKPHNVFITYGGQVRVLDFGGLSPEIADPWWVVESSGADRHGGYRAATPAYASCEQLEGLRADARDDIYALACIAYELLSGRHPFAGKSSVEARAHRLRLRRPRALQTRSWHALRAGLAWQRRQRPEQLSSWLEQLGVGLAAATLPPSHQLRSAPPPRAWPQPLAAAVVVLGCIGAVAFTTTRPGGPSWRRTLATAEASLQTARQNLQSTAAQAAAQVTPPTAVPDDAPSAVRPAAGPPTGTTRTSASAKAGADAGAGAGATGVASAHPAQPPRVRLAATDQFGRPIARVAPATQPPGADSLAAPTTGAAGKVTPSIAAAPPATQIEHLAGAAAIAFSAPSYTVDENAPAARLIVHRVGSSGNDLSFAWWTVEDSAKADVDFAPLGRRVEHIPAGADNVTIYVPIISNPLRHQTASFYVVLGPSSGADTQAGAQASVTIERGG